MAVTRKYTKLDRLKSRALRVAMTAFRREPKLGELHAQLLFSEILYLVKLGKDDDSIVNELVQKKRPESTLSAI